MPSSELIYAVDLGSFKFKIACGVLKEKGKVEVIELKEVDSSGILKGILQDPERAKNKLKEPLKQIEVSTGREIDEIMVNIGGSHLEMLFSKGESAVSKASQEVSKEDAERALSSAQNIALGENREILFFYPLGYRADGSELVSDPVGLTARKLEVETLIFTGFSPFVKNIYDLFESLEIEVKEIVPSVLASAEVVLSPEEKDLGVALIEFGARNTQVLVFEEGKPSLFFVIPAGSEHITDDLAVGLALKREVAELIKLEYGRFKSLKAKGKGEIEVGEAKKILFPLKEANRIILARVSQIFKEIYKRLKEENKLKKLPAGIVITGGGAKFKDIEKIANKELKLPVKIGVPQRKVLNLPLEPEYAVIAGLLKLGEESKVEWEEGKEAWWKRVKDWIKNFLPS